MAQFDVHDIPGHGLVVDCQSDLLSQLRSRLVVPLRLEHEMPKLMAALNPAFVLDGKRYILAAQFPRAVELRQLGPPIATLAAHDLTIKRALDIVISGI